jgi:hypothetical protein
MQCIYDQQHLAIFATIKQRSQMKCTQRIIHQNNTIVI